MPISFLAPVFLAGLAALAIPVLIHLANRPKKETVPFPSLMFLDPVEYRDASRRRLRDVLLFLVRALALVLLIAAFARPFVDRADAVPAAPDGGREVVILLDRSESMGIGDRMARARAAVANVAAGLRRGDRATLVAFDREAAALHQATDQAAVVDRAAAGVRPGTGATHYLPALRLAESILTGTPLPRRELVLVSDFQRGDWSGGEAPRMPAGAAVRMVPVGSAVGNRYVAGAELDRDRFSGRDRVRVVASIGSLPAGTDGGAAGADAAVAPASVPVELVVDGRTVQRRAVDVPAGGSARVEFDPLTLPDRSVRGTVRAGTDAMHGDNVFHFVLSPRQALRVLHVTPRAGATPFVERGLAAGGRLDLAAVREDRLDAAALAGADVLVVEGQPSAAALGDVERWVRAGGGLVVVLGPDTRARRWSDRRLLPGAVGGIREAAVGAGDDGGAALTDLALPHPALAPLRAAPTALTGGRVYRYRELVPAADATVLARFDGRHAAVAAGTAGRGRVLVVASALDGAWNDLAVQPGFVPFLHGLVRHAAGREPPPEWRRVGELLEPASLLAGGPFGSGSEPGAAPVLLTPSDRPLPLRPDSLYALAERGFYEVRDPRSDTEPVVVAVNGDPSESVLTAVDPAAVRAAVDGGPAGALTASFAREDRERRQSLWWYFLAGSFVLMALETLLSNRLSRRPLRRREGG